jgi:hypothetical protein
MIIKVNMIKALSIMRMQKTSLMCYLPRALAWYCAQMPATATTS